MSATYLHESLRTVYRIDLLFGHASLDPTSAAAAAATNKAKDKNIYPPPLRGICPKPNSDANRTLNSNPLVTLIILTLNRKVFKP